jgi:hypothetical protein
MRRGSTVAAPSGCRGAVSVQGLWPIAPIRVFDEFGIRSAQCFELPVCCLLVRVAPAIFSPGAQTCFDDDSARDPLAERGETTGL